MRSDKSKFLRNGSFLKEMATCVSALALCIAAGQSAADDTEIFFGAGTKTNVLFILDNSGSMKNKDGTGITRLDRLKAALKTVLNTNEYFNAGLLAYSSQAIVLHEEIMPVTENKAALIASIDALGIGGGTPTQRALFEGVLYYRGEPAQYAKTESGNTVQTYVSPITNQCQSNHIVLLSDGYPTNDDSGHKAIAESMGVTCETVGVGEGENNVSNGTCGAEIANYASATDHSTLVNGFNNVTVHTVGLNFDEPWLASVATAGTGGTYNADTADELVDAFASIVEIAQSEGNSFVTPSITVDQFSRLSHREDTYLALFQPGNRTKWQGNLKRYSFSGNPAVLRDKNGDAAFDTATGTFHKDAHSFWSAAPDGPVVASGGAASKLNPATRNLYSYLGTTNVLNAAANHVSVANKTALQPYFYSTADLDKLLPWAHGVDVKDEDEDGFFDDNRMHMGDPLHSVPTVLNYGGTSANPDSVVFVGTNEGYLHAINSDDGTELYSFIPTDLLANLEDFYDNKVSGQRTYGLDGDITLWVDDKDNNGILDPDTEHAYLYVGMRRGGNNYYALNVTDKHNPLFMWSIKGGPDGNPDFAELGQSWSKPTLTKMRSDGEVKDVLVFGGGYDQMQDYSTIRSNDTIGRSLFIVDATDGSLLWTPAMDTQSDYSKMNYSMPSDPSLIDVDGDGLLDQIYIGDMGGQLWRFDIDNFATATDSTISGGIIASLSGDGEADNRRFFYPPDVVVTAHNGEQYLSVSIGSGNRAHPLDETVNNRFYMIRQEDIFHAPEGYGMVDAGPNANYRAITEADLYDATANDVNDSDSDVSLNAQQTLESKQGWRLHLEEPGEKVLAPSLTIENTILFSTYIPGQLNPADPCAPTIGGGRAYVVKLFDASPVNGPAVTDRHQTLDQTGIAGGPTATITENGDILPRVGFEPVEMPEISLTKRVYWSEQSDY